MSGDQRTLEESLKPFFGWSDGTVHFFNSNYSHSNYEIAVNSNANPDNLFGKTAESIIFAKNYNDPKNENPEDVHHQYIDFIIKTALFHREIDRPTLMGSGMKKFVDLIEQAIDFSMQHTVRDIKNDLRAVGQAHINDMLNNRGIILLNNNIPIGSPNRNDMNFTDLGLDDDSTYFEFIVGYLFMITKQLPRNININDTLTLLTTRIYSDFLDNSRQTATVTAGTVDNEIGVATDLRTETTIEGYIERLFGECNENGSIAPSTIFGSNYCHASLFNSDFISNRRRVQEPSNSLRSLIERAVQANTARVGHPPTLNTPAIMTDIIGLTHTVFKNCTIRLFQEMFLDNNDLNSAITKFSVLRDHQGARAPLRLINEIKILFNKILNRVKAREDVFKTCIKTGFISVIKPKLNQINFEEFTLVGDNNWTQKIIEEVFQNWKNLSPIAMKFYSKHLHIFGLKQAARGVLSNEYEDLMPAGRFNSFGFNRQNVRLNLMKARGLREVLFGETLPWIPTNNGQSRMGWYTAINGTVKSMTLQTDTIRRIYNDLYKFGEFKINNRTIDFPATYEQTLQIYENKDFDINDMQIIFNTIQQAKMQSQSQPQPLNNVVQFEDLFEDLATNETFRRDENGLFKMENGVKVYAGLAPINNCAGTNLNHSDNAQCVRIVRKCLIDGNKDELAKCLDELRDSNLFDVAQKELQGIHPDVALQILKTFGVGGKSINGVNVVESLNEWIDRVVRKLRDDVRDAILTNRQLKDYISGVIAFVNANPAIMNHNMTENQIVNVPENEEDQMGKKLFHKPSFTKNSNPKQLFASISNGLNSYLGVSKYLPPSLASMSSPNRYSNVIIGAHPMFSQVAFGQIGGANTGRLFEEKIEKRNASGEMGSALLEGLMNSVIRDLKDAKTPLRQQDIDAIKKGINQIKRNEEKLIELYVMMRTLVDLSDFFKASNPTFNLQQKDISVHQIRSRADVIKYLQNSINDIENTLSKNVNSQQSACDNMVRTFASIFENAANQ